MRIGRIVDPLYEPFCLEWMFSKPKINQYIYLQISSPLTFPPLEPLIKKLLPPGKKGNLFKHFYNPTTHLLADWLAEQATEQIFSTHSFKFFI